LIDSTSENIVRDYEILCEELHSYSKFLSEKDKILGISKLDLLNQTEVDKISEKIEKNISAEAIFFSAVTGYNIDKLLDMLWRKLNK
jgi:GTP-binding protein